MVAALEPVTQSLRNLGLIDDPDTAAFAPLNGGVSADIWRVETPSGPLCVKRATPQLRVAAEWSVPVERNAVEATWIRAAGDLIPGAVPRVIAEDPAAGLFVMSYFEPATHPVWKSRLLAGAVDTDFAAAVGARLAHLHAATAGQPDMARDFWRDDLFRALRIDPYLLATGRRHPDLEARLAALAETTLSNRRALIHGDVSPKNILAGPDGPVFLDAECAVYGDPAFDLAFCLNHLLLKCLARPEATERLLAAFAAMARAYRAGVTWEPVADLETRASHLLPALLLARVDGKSPLAYLNDRDQATVRAFARQHLAAPPANLDALADDWRMAVRPQGIAA